MAFETRQTLERRRFITLEEYRRLLDAAKKDKKAWTIFFVIGNLGLRVGEFHRILECDVSRKTPELVVRTEKQKKGKWVRQRSPKTGRTSRVWVPNPKVNAVDMLSGVPAPVMVVLRDWITSRKIRPGKPLFPWTKRWSQLIFDKYARKVGIKIEAEPGQKGRGIHCLRHFKGLQLVEAGVHPYKIQSVLRQRSFSATQLYLHSAGVRDALEAAGVVGEPPKKNGNPKKGGANGNAAKDEALSGGD